jgi:hypothetical protein
MKCKEIEPLLYLIRDGELTPEEATLVQHHLNGCEACRSLYNSVIAMTDQIRAGDFTPAYPEEIHVEVGRIMDNIEKQTAHERKAPLVSLHSLMVRGIAASLLLFISGAWLFQELDFYRNAAKLHTRLQTSIWTGTDQAGLPEQAELNASECIKRIQKELDITGSTSLSMAEFTSFYSGNEIRINQIIRRVCDSNAGDARIIKELLQQSGLEKMNITN